LPTSIKVIGVGGAGCKAVIHMLEAGLAGVAFIAVDSDPQSLVDSTASKQVLINDNPVQSLDG
jgi:cell division protein FtsZ